MNISQEKTKDFIAGLIALIFVVAAGYLALNRFNNNGELSLGTGGSDVAINGDALTDNSDESTDESYTNNVWTDWTATDYEQGDIESGDYTVAEGDTLWEISEAVYGDGSMWVNILSANSDSVGYLPNGQQALIYAGQTLLIP